VGESLNATALLVFRVQLILDGAELTAEEIAALTTAGDGLAFLRVQWVEVDGDKLREALELWQRVEAEAGEDAFRFWRGFACWLVPVAICPATIKHWMKAAGPSWRPAAACGRC
jgi:hypothetical protein